ETTFDAQWIIDNAKRAIYAMEEPPMAMAALAQFRTFELVASSGTTVVLDGQGADEIFAGYAYHERDLVLDRLGRFDLRGFARNMRAIADVHNRRVLPLIVTGRVVPSVRQRFAGYKWLPGSDEAVDFANFDGAR